MPENAMTVTGALTFYDRPADSGDVVSRGYCPTCGAAVLSKNSGMAGLAFPRASSLDDLEVAQPAMAVYASRKPSWGRLDDASTAFPEMPDQPPV
ncbi:MAG: GFA family protein [Caulobacterales bacterium]|nr:GFA family protein [Caulobacterales bacterium]